MRMGIWVAVVVAVLSLSSARSGEPGEAAVMVDKVQSSSEELKKLLAGFPNDYVDAAVVDGIEVKENGEDVFVKVKFSLKSEETKALIQKLAAFLDEAADKAVESKNLELTKSGAKDGTYDFRYTQDVPWKENAKKSSISLVTRSNDPLTLVKSKYYEVPDELLKIFDDTIRNSRVMAIELQGEGGKSIAKDVFESPRIFHDYSFSGNVRSYVVFPFISDIRWGRMTAARLPGQREITLSYKFKLFPDETKEIKEVVVRFEEKE